MQNYECWSATATIVMSAVAMNWVCAMVTVGLVWWVVERKHSPTPPTKVAELVEPDEYDDDALVHALRRSSTPPQQIEQVTEALKSVTKITEVTDLQGMSSTLMTVANDVSKIINDDTNIPRSKKHELVQILSNIPDFIQKVSEVQGGTSTRVDDGQKLIQILDSLK